MLSEFFLSELIFNRFSTTPYVRIETGHSPLSKTDIIRYPFGLTTCECYVYYWLYPTNNVI